MTLRRDSVRAVDGTRIDFKVAGQGPALLMSNGLTTTDTFWKYLREQLSPNYTIITWDFPGHGTSEPARSEQLCEIEALPDIAVRILDKLGIERAVHVGFSVGCQVALESMRKHAARWDALALLFGTPGHVLSTSRLPVPGPVLLRLVRDMPDVVFAPGFREFARVANLPLSRDLARKLNLLGKAASDADLSEMMEHLTRIDPWSMRRIAASAEAHSAQDLLPSLHLPVLIMAAGRDAFAPARSVCAPLHRAIQGSEFVLIENATHTALLEQPELTGRVLSDFLQRRVVNAAPATRCPA